MIKFMFELKLICKNYLSLTFTKLGFYVKPTFKNNHAYKRTEFTLQIDFEAPHTKDKKKKKNKQT